MITGPKGKFMARCQERGYTLEQVKPCIVSDDGDIVTVDELHPAYPKAPERATARPPAAGRSTRPAKGPGTELKKLLSLAGITATPGCKCNGRARVMDTKGPDWCEANLDTIVGWLREEATKRNLPFVDMAGRLLVKRAIRNARRAAG